MPSRKLRNARWWLAAWTAIAVVSAIPVALEARHRLLDVTRSARATLIVEHRLWELHPEYAGSPEAWTRFASRLLTDRQLLRRVRARYGDRARQIEIDYRHDLTIAQAEVAVVAVAAWAAPMGMLFGLGYAALRYRQRRNTPPPAVPRPRDDARYRP